MFPTGRRDRIGAGACSACKPAVREIVHHGALLGIGMRSSSAAIWIPGRDFRSGASPAVGRPAAKAALRSVILRYVKLLFGLQKYCQV
jgi:hypothetical protein